MRRAAVGIPNTFVPRGATAESEAFYDAFKGRGRESGKTSPTSTTVLLNRRLERSRRGGYHRASRLTLRVFHWGLRWPMLVRTI